MDFYDWLIQEKKLSEATASKYNLVIKNRISEWMPSYEMPKNSIEFEALKLTIFDLDIYKERNRIGNNMYSSALNHFGNYLKQKNQDQSVIWNTAHEFSSEAARIIKIRLVQNKFRLGLFEMNPKCLISGLTNPKLLIASHIKPWSKCNDQERIDPYNGFLLTPNYDRLFDQGFISFQMDGKVLISKKLTQSDQAFFQLPQIVNFKFSKQHEPYLAFHQREIFIDR